MLHVVMHIQEAEQLVSIKIHPQTIINGWRKAVDCARQALTNAARDNRFATSVLFFCTTTCNSIMYSLINFCVF